MMKVHELKTINPYFQDVINGFKDFEIRLNDRKFGIGDILILKEFVEGKYTGAKSHKKIKYILPIENILEVQTSDFWSINKIMKYGIVILGLDNIVMSDYSTLHSFSN